MTRQQQRKREHEATMVRHFNKRHPIGTSVRAWPGVREGDGKLTKTIGEAFVLGEHTAVVFVKDVRGAIALSHIEVV